MRLRFTIRDLFWLMTLVAVLLAWWMDHRKLTENHQPQITIYSIRYADPATIPKVLPAMYVGATDVRIKADMKTNHLIAVYSTDSHQPKSLQ